MAAENTTTSTPNPNASSSSSTPNIPAQVQTPTPTYTTTGQWTSQIPIDPALQQQSPQGHATPSPYQHYQAYTSHYPQAAYATHYQAYAPQPVAQTQQQVLSRLPSIAPPQSNVSTITPAANSGGGGMDTADINTLNDALGSAGVDLRAEEESLQRTHSPLVPYRPHEDRTRKQPAPPAPAFDTRVIQSTMRTIGTSHKVTRIPDDTASYLALALRARLSDLVRSMVSAAKHRTQSGWDKPPGWYDPPDGDHEEEEEEKKLPMWSLTVRSDVAKQLAVIERIEREEETRIRRERKERAELAAAHAAALAAQANGAAAAAGLPTSGMGAGGGEDGEDGQAKKKRKKDGPGVTARNMSEDVRKKMSNAVATQAAGLGGRYAWMNAAASGSPASKPKPAQPATTTPPAAAVATTSTPSTSTQNTTTPSTTPVSTQPLAAATTTNPATGSTWARPYVPTKKSLTAASSTSTNASSASGALEEDTRLIVTMRDAMFVVSKDRGHGGGRGAARGWT